VLTCTLAIPGADAHVREQERKRKELKAAKKEQREAEREWEVATQVALPPVLKYMPVLENASLRHRHCFIPSDVGLSTLSAVHVSVCQCLCLCLCLCVCVCVCVCFYSESIE